MFSDKEPLRRSVNQEFYGVKRGNELEKNAQLAYEMVLTQEEMLGGCNLTPEDAEPAPNADPGITREIDEVLYEAAQQGNIGGD